MEHLTIQSYGTTTTTLLDLFTNSVLFDNIIPYLPLQALIRLSRTSRAFRDFVLQTPTVFRYLDLSRCRGAYIPPELTRIDPGGNPWRAARMDENLTEDEFYAGPLRGILSRLEKQSILKDVHVLVLDGLSSVTNDLVFEIATREDCNVKILSIRKCINVNQTRLQQFLKFLCRPSRPEGTPRLQGLYLFTEPETTKRVQDRHTGSEGVMVADGAILGVLPVDKSRGESDGCLWYAPSGQVVAQGHAQRSSWEETIATCKGIIAFDVVLCTSMHEAMSSCLHEASQDFLTQNKPGIATMATMALGSEGCAGCGSAPTGTPSWPDSNPFEFPLLWPPPRSGRIIDAVRPPNCSRGSLRSRTTGPRENGRRLIVSCTWCLTNRHCDSCHRWWCGDCYNPKRLNKLSDLEALSNAGYNGYLSSQDELSLSGAGVSGDSVKVFNGFCVENCLVSEMMSGAGSMGMWA